jgi:hypothetical protein
MDRRLGAFGILVGGKAGAPMSAIVNSGGLGAGLGTDYRVDCSSGNTIDCDSWSNFFNSTCWGMCSASSLPAGVVVGGPPAAPATPDMCQSVVGVSCNIVGFVAAGLAILVLLKR